MRISGLSPSRAVTRAEWSEEGTMFHAKTGYSALTTVSALFVFVAGCSDSDSKTSATASQSLTVPLASVPGVKSGANTACADAPTSRAMVWLL